MSGRHGLATVDPVSSSSTSSKVPSSDSMIYRAVVNSHMMGLPTPQLHETLNTHTQGFVEELQGAKR